MAKEVKAVLRSSETKKSTPFMLVLCIVFVFATVFGVSFLSFLQNKTTRYVVASQGTLTDEFAVKAVITREETLVRASSEGVVRYYYAGGRKLQKNTQIGVFLDPYYGDLLDAKIAQVYNELEEQDAGDKQAFENIEKEMLADITAFLQSERNGSLRGLYELKNNLTESRRHRLELFSISANKRVLALLAEAGVYLNEQESETSKLYVRESGLIEYSYDGYESWTTDQIGADFIENYKSSYSFLKVELKNREVGEPLYRVITSEDWYLTLYLSNSEAAFFSDRSNVSFTYNGEEKMEGKITLLTKAGDQWKMVLKVSSNMQAHDNERIAELTFVKNTATGIQVPEDCIVQLDLYYLPLHFIENNTKVLRSRNGEIETVAVNVLYKDGQYAYFDLPDEGLVIGDRVISISEKKEGEMETSVILEHRILEGVYVVNVATERFAVVDTLFRYNGYAIVSGISMYDRIKL